DWAFYAPFVTFQNVLWGDFFIVNSEQNFADGDNLVHIEASAPPATIVPPPGSVVAPFVAGEHTFYGRYNAATAADQREPLATTWASRFINGGAFSGGTDFIVWREANSAASGYNCNLSGPSSWYPLESTQIVIFDEEEQPVTSEECPSGDPTCEQTITIPNESQRVDVATQLLAPFDFGWAYPNLQHNNAGFVAIYGDTFAQSWVEPVMDAEGRYSVCFAGIQLDNANTPITTFIPVQ